MQERAVVPAETLATATLWDWRRRVADLWASIRANPDPKAAWDQWRAAREDLFLHHAQTPLDAGGALPEYFDYDPALRFAVDLAPARIDASFQMPAGNDGSVELTPFAETSGLASRLGGELTLYWVGGYGGGTFLPFLDATSGHDTYGGGRYLIDSIKSADHGATADGKTVLDFNFAYNPSCYYSPRWVCPLAPRSNRLPGAVRGGEKGYSS